MPFTRRGRAPHTSVGVGAAKYLEEGRDAYARNAWAEAFERLSEADRVAALESEDLERLARSAYMIGRDDDYRDGLSRAHHWYVRSGEAPRAARCAFWI